MRKGFIITLLCGVCALVFVYAAYGQSKETLDKLKEAETLIKIHDRTRKLIKTIEEERYVNKMMKIFNVSDLLEESRIKDYAPPSPYVFDVESASKMELEEDTEDYDEYFGPDELIELVRASTGEWKWPDLPDGFGTIECYRGRLVVINTPEVVGEISMLLDSLRKKLPVLISSSVYLLSAEGDYLEEQRENGSSVVSAKTTKKILDDANAGRGVKLLRTGYLTSYSAQAAYVHSGALHTYIGNTDTSGTGGESAAAVFDPVINVFREGFIIGLRAQYMKEPGTINLVAMISLSKLTAIEEHVGIGGGGGEKGPVKVKIETPKVDLQVVSGSADVPLGHGLLVGGSKLRTAQAKQQCFVVLIVPAVMK